MQSPHRSSFPSAGQSFPLGLYNFPAFYRGLYPPWPAPKSRFQAPAQVPEGEAGSLPRDVGDARENVAVAPMSQAPGMRRCPGTGDHAVSPRAAQMP